MRLNATMIFDGVADNSEAVELQFPASYFDVLRTAGIRARSAESASGR
jgi:hypothetical protein